MSGGQFVDEAAVATVSNLMDRFALETGIDDGSGPPRRYLWTDAFAVCNFLELGCKTGEARWNNLALALVAQVHDVLGRHRGDDGRSGWISGLGEIEGRQHPTAGGLRIGKKLAERQPSEPIDERLEWDRDGQYFHYLTKWVHALARVGASTGDLIYVRWAAELMQAACRGFVQRTTAGDTRMIWKASIDLTRPLVPSMGHHDPLDGLVTAQEVQGALFSHQLDLETALDLANEISELTALCHGRRWVTDDPLGLGGLMFDAYRVLQMMQRSAPFNGGALLVDLLGDALSGLGAYTARSGLDQPASYRLAFRELGVSIGLHAVERMPRWLDSSAQNQAGKEVRRIADMLAHYRPLIELIEGFWLRPAHREARSWREHADINAVMLATSLMPDGFLTV